MKLVVCVKKVPDTETTIKIHSDGKSIEQAGVNFVMNPYDEFAVEQALQWKEATQGEVIAISLGNGDVEKVLRTALAMGCDKAIHLKCDSYTGLEDPAAVASALASNIQALEANAVLFGRQAIDSDQSVIPGLVAAQLGWAFVGYGSSFTFSDKDVSIQREVDGGEEQFKVPLPACISVDKGKTAPRYASLKGVMAAKSKPLDVVETSLEGEKMLITKLELPPERTAGKIVGEGPDAVPQLVKLLQDEAKVI